MSVHTIDPVEVRGDPTDTELAVVLAVLELHRRSSPPPADEEPPNVPSRISRRPRARTRWRAAIADRAFHAHLSTAPLHSP